MSVRRGRSVLFRSFLVGQEIRGGESISKNLWVLAFENVTQANHSHLRKMQIHQGSCIVMGLHTPEAHP